jgi:hypothetical protein
VHRRAAGLLAKHTLIAAEKSGTLEEQDAEAHDGDPTASGPDAQPAPEPDAGVDTDPPVITATGLGVDGEHGPLFAGIELTLTSGLHAIQLPGGPPQDALLLTIAGRLKPTHGTVAVLGDTEPRAIRRHTAIAAFANIDELDDSVTVQTVLAEQSRWLARWYARVPIEAGQDQMRKLFGDIEPPRPGGYIVELSDLQLFLLRITLALMSDRPILVVGDLEQVRDNAERTLAVERLGEIATGRTVVVGVTNPLGFDAPDHGLHDHRILVERD